MYIGPWQELRLGQLLNDHKRLMEQSVHQQLQIIKQQQIIHTMHQQQQQQQRQPPSATSTQPHTARTSDYRLSVSSLPSVLSVQSPRSHSHRLSYVPTLTRDQSTASTWSNSSIASTSSSLVHYHHSTDPFPLPPLPILSHSSSPNSRRSLVGAGQGEQERRKKRSSRATKEQVAAGRREQIEKMRVMYGLNGGKQVDEQKEQEREDSVEPYERERTPPTTTFPSLPRQQRLASSDVQSISAGSDQRDPIHLPDAIADYLISAARQPKPLYATTGALPELSSANLLARSQDATEQSSSASDGLYGADFDNASTRTPSTADQTATSQCAPHARTAKSTATVESSSLPLWRPLSPLAQPTPRSTQPPSARSPSVPLSPTTRFSVLRRVTDGPAPPRLSEEEYLRGIAVNRRQQRPSLEAQGVEVEDGATMRELQEQLGSGWAAQYNIVVRPQAALLLTQLAAFSVLSSPLQRSAVVPASMPSSMRMLGVTEPTTPPPTDGASESRSLQRPVVPFTLNDSQPHSSETDAQPVDLTIVPPAESSLASTFTPSTPHTLAAVHHSPLIIAAPAATRSLSLFARGSLDAQPSAQPPPRPSMELTLQARRAFSLEPLSVVDGRERRSTSVASDMDEVSTAMLEEETEKLLSFVQTASDGMATLARENTCDP